MMSQIRLRQSQAGERLGRVDGRYVVEGVMQEQLKQVRNVCSKWFLLSLEQYWKVFKSCLPTSNWKSIDIEMKKFEVLFSLFIFSGVKLNVQ